MSLLIKQYQSIKAKYPHAVLLFRVGDFYETFNEDAKIIAQHTGVTLIQSDNEESKVMAGFPFYSLDGYLKILVKAGYRVAVCEQLEDPKRAKGTVKRGVTDFFKP